MKVALVGLLVLGLIWSGARIVKAAEVWDGVEWDYSRLFGPGDIPKPADGSAVKAVYSPSVLKVNQKYVMFFGVSVYCQNWTVARDSVAVAESGDGISWQFKKYIIEPDAQACSLPLGQWPSKNFTYQINDPTAVVNKNDTGEILVFYTAVNSNTMELGNIGLAKFNLNLEQISRNDKYIEAGGSGIGRSFSRPEVEWEAEKARLWFDNMGKVGSIELDNLTKVEGLKAKDEGVNGIDIEVADLGEGGKWLLSGGEKILGYKRAASGWESGKFITQKSGQGWDEYSQGSPYLWLDKATCQTKLYMAGAKMNPERTEYLSIDLGVAVPKNGGKLNLTSCEPGRSPTPTPTSQSCLVCPGKTTKTKGDANCDGVIDFADYGVWRREYFDEGGRSGGVKENWQSNFDCSRDGNKQVTGADFQVWLSSCVIDPKGRCN